MRCPFLTTFLTTNHYPNSTRNSELQIAGQAKTRNRMYHPRAPVIELLLYELEALQGFETFFSQLRIYGIILHTGPKPMMGRNRSG